jgi:hypothetical protein
MDRSTHKPATRPHYTIFANANNIYTIDFDKMKKWTETAPYFSAVLRRIKPSSPLQQILNAAQQRTINQINQLGQINTQEQANKLMNVIKTEILPQVVHISDIASQTERVPVQQLDDILAGEEISLNVENNTVSLSK